MIVLKNCNIYSMENNGIAYGDILIKGGKIEKIDSSITQDDAKVIYIKNNIVMPGLIDGHCHLGLVEDGIAFEGNDLNEVTDPVTPHLRAVDGINMFDRSFKEALQAGVTAAAISPGKSNIIGGQTCVLKTWGKTLQQMVIKSSAAFNVNIGDSPKRSNFGKVEMPMSRMAEAYLLRKTLKEAQYYNENNGYQGGLVGYSKFNMKYEALKPVLSLEAPLRVAAHKLQDILTAMSIADEFGIKIVLDYCTEGYLILEQIISRNIPVMLGSYLTDSSNAELLQRSPKAPAIFSKAGVLTSLITDHPDVPVQFLPVCAGLAVKEGMEYYAALKAITINPAKALGIDNRVGSIREGKDADIIVLDGDPLKIRTKVLMTIIGGNVVYEA